jgi:hypothetical protein
MSKINLKLTGNVLKVAIVLLAATTLFFAIRRFLTDEGDVQLFREQVATQPILLIFAIMLMPINWFLEVAKWKNIIAVREQISWREAWSGVLAGLAIGAATPNRVGEFAGRVFQLKKATIYEGISCTLVCSMMQVTVTVLAGIIGLLLVDTSQVIHSTTTIIWALVIVVLIGLFLLIVRNVKGKFVKYVNVLRALHFTKWLSVFSLSGLRYSVYVLQFFLLLRLFGIAGGTMHLFGAIALNYLVITIIPSIMMSELFIRGSVASGVIGVLCGRPEAAAVAAVVLWLLNVGIPAIFGMFFVRKISLIRKGK